MLFDDIVRSVKRDKDDDWLITFHAHAAYYRMSAKHTLALQVLLHSLAMKRRVDVDVDPQTLAISDVTHQVPPRER